MAGATEATLREVCEHLAPIDKTTRSAAEVTHVQGVRMAPEGIEGCNPAFDVTPNRYVTAIITEKGVARAPYNESLRGL